MLSPEMLSDEETLSFMLEVMRRATQSSQMLNLIVTNEEFKHLSMSLLREVDEVEKSMYEATCSNYSSKTTNR